MPGKPKVFRSIPAAARPQSSDRGYDKRWARASAQFRRDNPLCVGCRAIGRLEAATVTDHIVPHRGDAEIFWQAQWWQPSCDWHHNVVKRRLEDMYDRGQLSPDDLRLNSSVAIAMTMALTDDDAPFGRGN